MHGAKLHDDRGRKSDRSGCKVAVLGGRRFDRIALNTRGIQTFKRTVECLGAVAKLPKDKPEFALARCVTFQLTPAAISLTRRLHDSTYDNDVPASIHGRGWYAKHLSPRDITGRHCTRRRACGGSTATARLGQPYPKHERDATDRQSPQSDTSDGVR